MGGEGLQVGGNSRPRPRIKASDGERHRSGGDSSGGHWGFVGGGLHGAPCPFYETNLEILAPYVYAARSGFFAPFSMPKSDSGPMTLVGSDYQRSATRGIRILLNKCGLIKAPIHPSRVPYPGPLSKEETLNK